MNIQAFQKKFNKIYQKEIEKIIIKINKQLLKYNPELKDLANQLYKILIGGKKIRPYLLYSTYSIFSSSKNKNINSVKNILIGLELFHNFCLIHDDIMDNGKSRHQTETINYYLFKKFKKNQNKKLIAKFSESEAILIGDLIFKETFLIFEKHNWENNKLRKNFYKEYFEMIDLVLYGQMVDIYLTIEKNYDYKKIISKNILKTSYYSFVKPMRLGYVLSGNYDNKEMKTLDKIGIILGLIYQIQDDVFDALKNKKNLGKDILNDIVNNQKTFLTYYLAKQNFKKFNLIKQKLINNDINKKELEKYLKKSKIIELSSKEINKLKNQLDKINIKNKNFKNFIDYILNFILNRLN